jgi:DNA mismatch endonuclease (patch repair protein)
MRANRRRDTKPEKMIRSLLHARGRRFRVDYPIPVEGRRPIRPDIVFTRQRLCIEIDGCWWHGCELHGVRGTVANPAYWGPKIARNKERDREKDTALRQAGWRVLRFWEHEKPESVASAIEAALDYHAATGRSRP